MLCCAPWVPGLRPKDYIGPRTIIIATGVFLEGTWHDFFASTDGHGGRGAMKPWFECHSLKAAQCLVDKSTLSFKTFQHPGDLGNGLAPRNHWHP